MNWTIAISVILAFIAGGCFGFLTAALCCAAGRADEAAERSMQDNTQERSQKDDSSIDWEDDCR